MGFSDFFKKKENKIMNEDLIRLGVKVANKEEAVKIAGELLYDNGYVEEDYLEAMQEREKDVSTFMGNGVAIPHGTNKAKKYIKKTGLSFVQIPEGVDFGDGNTAHIVIGIAGKGDEHLQILQNLATILQDEEKTEALTKTDDKKIVLKELL
ncbi:PTS system D-mannitol-specific IIA component (Fru family) [Halanaerobium saccharolyticum]|uniref:Mannitol-specific phosphotransferase enzyme IIA component n=1 Tax=Halanaerobium saccharolyticum TaxID=43595 RepID=A0A4R7YZ76_9FIRM|nr:PTS sugar transporter subunit IIA [Halanaerobium saccharolyticum]RAK07763.1 PTS system D-mannitol-specific IIA component (Fru family) [Halanaerobium saccharolyticum]TDW03628.1 PTS system D-mannitol-specific IIA component (Fru family) [Halanaerobium saccharolyticum]TDX59467.1 PTS system D-mannitol-specific IIA component (Fru family) [Halanaerobium saccharolyticum]